MKMTGRMICIMAAAALAFGSLCAAVNAWMILSAKRCILSAQQAAGAQADCILVLGCGLRADGYPSRMLRDRLDVGIELYRLGAAPKLLMSGDHGQADYDEVNAMKDYAMAQGVPSEDIFMDHAGFSTYESMYRAKAIFQCERIIAVTQRYHLYRAIHNARAMGMEAAGVPCDLHDYGSLRRFELREAAARVKDALWGIVRPKPTYLGEAVPIFGNGDVTNDR